MQLPNGAVISRTFAAEAEMCDVYDWVTGSQEVSEQEVDPKRLVLQQTTLERRQLPADRARLANLGLCPVRPVLATRLSAVRVSVS